MRAAAACAVAAAVLFAAAWATRWQVMHMDVDRRVIYMLNRWTGDMRLVSGPEWIPIEMRTRPIPPQELPAAR